MGAPLNRDELLETLRGVAAHVLDCGPCAFEVDLGRTIAWLERLPPGCELVGLEGFAEGRGLGETLPPDPVVFRTEAKRGMSFVWRTVFLNPDDLTKAGKR